MGGLAYLFSAFGVLTVFGTGNATQVNTITTAINSAMLNFSHYRHRRSRDVKSDYRNSNGGSGGADPARRSKTDRSGSGEACTVYGAFYIVLALGVVAVNIQVLPSVFASIFEGHSVRPQ